LPVLFLSPLPFFLRYYAAARNRKEKEGVVLFSPLFPHVISFLDRAAGKRHTRALKRRWRWRFFFFFPPSLPPNHLPAPLTNNKQSFLMTIPPFSFFFFSVSPPPRASDNRMQRNYLKWAAPSSFLPPPPRTLICPTF